MGLSSELLCICLSRKEGVERGDGCLKQASLDDRVLVGLRLFCFLFESSTFSTVARLKRSDNTTEQTTCSFGGGLVSRSATFDSSRKSRSAMVRIVRAHVRGTENGNPSPDSDLCGRNPRIRTTKSQDSQDRMKSGKYGHCMNLF